MYKFGWRLENLREKSGYSKKEISLKLGFTPNVYGSYEREERRPSLETLVKLATIFDVSLDYLIKGEEHYEKENAKIVDVSSDYQIKGKQYQHPTSFDDEVEIKMKNILGYFDKAGMDEPYILQHNKWAILSKKDIKELSDHFEWVVEKAYRRMKGPSS